MAVFWGDFPMFQPYRMFAVVSTVMSNIHFGRFSTVEHVSDHIRLSSITKDRWGKSFLLISKVREKKRKRKQSLSLTHCAVIYNTHISHNNKLSFSTGTLLNNDDVIKRKLQPLVT